LSITNCNGYGTRRNHPETDHTSRLSPYLHFGHISPITVALAVENANAPTADKEALLNQIITWRELSVNLVVSHPNYDNFECAEPWAHRTLAAHAKDRRPVLYTESQLENAETHDQLWNAAQMQVVNTGWMHNYVRMYWAKKILEWSRTPAEAHRVAVRLNDKYELDGRDPNGYAGIAWAIVGKVRPHVVRAAHVRADPLHVGRKHGKEVRQQEIHSAEFDTSAILENAYTSPPSVIPRQAAINPLSTLTWDKFPPAASPVAPAVPAAAWAFAEAWHRAARCCRRRSP
jgi:hypothetical protein